MNNILDKYHISKLNQDHVNNITCKKIGGDIKSLTPRPSQKSHGGWVQSRILVEL